MTTHASKLTQDPTNQLEIEIVQHALAAGKILHGFTQFGKFSSRGITDEEKSPAAKCKAITQAHKEMIALMAAYNKLRTRFGLDENQYAIIGTHDAEQVEQHASLEVINTMVGGLMSETPSLGTSAQRVWEDRQYKLKVKENTNPDLQPAAKELREIGLIGLFFADQGHTHSESDHILPAINQFMEGYGAGAARINS